MGLTAKLYEWVNGNFMKLNRAECTDLHMKWKPYSDRGWGKISWRAALWNKVLRSYQTAGWKWTSSTSGQKINPTALWSILKWTELVVQGERFSSSIHHLLDCTWNTVSTFGPTIQDRYLQTVASSSKGNQGRLKLGAKKGLQAKLERQKRNGYTEQMPLPSPVKR